MKDVKFMIALSNKEKCTKHKPVKLPYLKWIDWAEKKFRQGEKQKKCSKCGHWFFKEEF